VAAIDGPLTVTLKALAMQSGARVRWSRFAIWNRKRTSRRKSWPKIACKYASNPMRYLLSASLRTFPSALWLFATGCWFIAALVCLFSAVTARGDSLWTTPNSDQRSMCADRKAARIGDIITIVVSETARRSRPRARPQFHVRRRFFRQPVLFPSTVSKFGTSGARCRRSSSAGKAITPGRRGQQFAVDYRRAAVLVTEVLPTATS